MRAVIALTGVLTVAYLSHGPALQAVNVFMRGADQSFVTYRLLSERDALLAANQQLQEELEILKSKPSPTGNAFEASVRSQLDELQGIIAAATELDLGEDGPTVARKGKGATKGNELAVARKTAPGRTSKRSKAPAMGGKEVDCGDDGECTGRVGKRTISLQIGPSFFEPKAPAPFEGEAPAEESPHAPTERDLLRRLAAISQGLRALPIGYPAEGDITSHYGYRVSPFSRRASFHEGMDLSLDTGGDVVSTGDGVVTAVRYDRAYGWMIDIDHSPSVGTRYAHLSKTLVKVGQRVSRGDKIALSGNTGRSTGPHLHYEVRINGRARNPKQFALLPQRLASVF
jgi:murein DD-endopeptidase MepM/ murein hydrolase activator NlpD